MDNYALKLRHIMPTFIYVTLATLAGMALVRYLLTIQFQILDFKIEAWEFWIPMAFTWIPITIWIRPKLRILDFESDVDRRQFIYQVLTWGTMAASMIVCQKYLTTASGKIQDVANMSELDKKEESRYYRIGSFETIQGRGGSYVDATISGKYNEYLNMHLYFAFPMVDGTKHTQTEEFKYWYGVSFKKQISNRLSDAEKDRQYDAFYNHSVFTLNTHDFNDAKYFERLPNTDDRDGFVKAVSGNVNADAKIVILEPRNDSFENRTGNMLPWIFGSWLIGACVMLFALFFPGVNTLEVERQREGKKPETDDVISMLKFLVPNKPHLVTSVILDLNLVIFMLMIFAGVHLVHPNAMDLLEWGGNRRLETTSGDWWRLISSMFVHAGFMHLMLNAYALVLASIFIEPLIGPVRYAIIYFAAGIAGGIASLWWHENTVSIGASGAIFGLFGTILSATLTNVIEKQDKKMILILFGPYVLINLIIGFMGGVDNAAHIGGFVAGIIGGLIIYSTMKKEQLDENTSTQ